MKYSSEIESVGSWIVFILLVVFILFGGAIISHRQTLDRHTALDPNNEKFAEYKQWCEDHDGFFKVGLAPYCEFAPSSKK